MVLNRLSRMRGLTIMPATCVKAFAPEDQRIYLQIDGEFAGRLPAEIRIVPDALTVLLGREYGK